MTQCEALLADFQRGNALTHLDARDRHQCLRLAARVDDLKKLGYDIRKKMIQGQSGKWIALYWLELPKGQLEFSMFQQKGPCGGSPSGASHIAINCAAVSPARQ